MAEKRYKLIFFKAYSYLKRVLTSYLWCFALSFLLLSITGVIPPYKRSFVCNDEKIDKPFRGDTVTPLLFTLNTLLLPSLVIFLTDRSTLKNGVRGWRTDVRRYLRGLLYVLTVTELLKISVGELRPHFLHSCLPDVKCVAGIVSSYNCTDTRSSWLRKLDVYKSFPSGHASLSSYMFLYIYFYSEERIRKGSVRLFIRIMFLVWSFVCCITRITDDRHFWWDVLFGAILGIVQGFVMITYNRTQEESLQKL
ncbi:phospholipid phosphatase 3-like [Centruroides sculpturatus]|uniref:phospholipid phosphatase 3-like n=1 Tax=Centruroides sculpturatus TaxID=218467 RepID=UPI000C6D97EC|nr:phospholipid phosphatase 3-like [Centruroides sculpturatus]